MRKTILILLACTVILLLGFSGYRAYELWKQSHWMSMARKFSASGDLKNEVLCLEQVLNLNPRNVDACRMMADEAEATQSPAALPLRKKVLELDPTSLNDHFALIQTALMAHDFYTVSSTLADVDAAGKKTGPYYYLSGEYALASGKIDEAEADYAEASRIDPANPAPQLSLAMLEIHGTNTLDMAEARITLTRLSLNSTNFYIRSQADRELVLDALRFKDDSTALAYSKDLVQMPIVPFPDKLLRLDVLWEGRSDEYRPNLVSCEYDAATNSQNLTEMALWFMQRNMPSHALAWMQSLPASTQTNLPAAMLMAQCQMLLQNWSALQNTDSKQDWGSLDFNRHAYLSRALREQGLDDASKAEWDVAMKSASDSSGALADLLRLTYQWNWQDESQEVLWTIVNSFPQDQWADSMLAGILYNNGNTRPLMQLYKIELSRDPSNLNAKSNLALTALLLRAQELYPNDLAHDVYEQEPTNSFYACVYAFSLHLQRKDPQALKIMQQLTSQDLGNRVRGGYYGLILKGVGQNAQASAYLQRSLKGQLLPEERAMFQQALNGL